MANSSKYTFEPKRRDVSIRVPHKGWTITVDTLTDEQAEWMLARGTWPDLLVLKSEAAEDVAEEKPKRGRPAKK